MKRGILSFVILLVILSGAVILYAASGLEKSDNTLVIRELNSSESFVIPPSQTATTSQYFTATHSGTPTTGLNVAAAAKPKTKPSRSNKDTTPRNYIDSTTGMEFVPVSGGCFLMGDNNGDSDERPAHQVCVDDFYVGKSVVSQRLVE